MNEIDYKVSKTESRYCSNIVLLNKRLESFMCFRGCTKFRWASVYHWRPLITMKSSIKPSIVAIGSGRQATRARGSSTGLTDTSSTSLAPLRHLSASGPFRWAGFSRFLFLSFFLSSSPTDWFSFLFLSPSSFGSSRSRPNGVLRDGDWDDAAISPNVSRASPARHLRRQNPR